MNRKQGQPRTKIVRGQSSCAAGEKIVMKKKLVMTGFGLAAVLTGAVALAGTWSGPFALISIEVDDTGTGSQTFLQYAEPFAPTGVPLCGSQAKQFMASGSADYVKAITDLATSAFLAGRRVKAYFDGTCSTGSATCTAPGPNCHAKFKAFALSTE